jgi:hypothetical protein
LNDATGTLMSCAHKTRYSKNCFVGLIIGKFGKAKVSKNIIPAICIGLRGWTKNKIIFLFDKCFCILYIM